MGRFILACASAQETKGGIWQAHLPDPVGINLYAKQYQKYFWRFKVSK